MNRNRCKKQTKLAAILGLTAVLGSAHILPVMAAQSKAKQPNFLFITTDDESWFEHSLYGTTNLPTPNFDRIANNGILFKNAYVSAPSCAPSRAAMLTGKNFWELEQAALMQAIFPKKFKTYPHILAANGYESAMCGKAWGPGVKAREGHSPSECAGNPYFNHKIADQEKRKYLYPYDYVANFEEFLKERDTEKPFCFWAGIFEPHGIWPKGAWARKQIKSEFGIDLSTIKQDYLLSSNESMPAAKTPGFYYEMLYMDREIGKLLDSLETRGILDNTVVIYLGDNGTHYMGKSTRAIKGLKTKNNEVNRGKASPYDVGVHVPMALMWKDKVAPGRVVEDFISATDIAPTFLDIAGVKQPADMSGKSFTNILYSKQSGLVDPTRNFIMTGMEFHYDRDGISL